MGNSKKNIVIKVIGNVVVIGIRVGLVVVEWRVLGTVKGLGLSKSARFITNAVFLERMTQHVTDALDRMDSIWTQYNKYRERRIKEDLEKVNELAKSIQTGTEDQAEEALKEAIEEFKLEGLDWDKYQEEMLESVNEFLKKTQTAV